MSSGLATLSAAGHRRRFARREVLFHEDDPGDALHVVVKGRVAVQVRTGLGASVTLDVLGRDDVLGELALLEPPAPRSATAVALEPTETLAVAGSIVRQLRADDRDVDALFLEVLTRRNRRLLARLAEMASLPADLRVLRRLADVAAMEASDEVHLTQDDLAGLAGTTRETVNRALHRAAQQGVLAVGRGRVTVLDPTRLASS